MERLDSGFSRNFSITECHKYINGEAGQTVVGIIYGTIRSRQGTRLGKPIFFRAEIVEPNPDAISLIGPWPIIVRRIGSRKTCWEIAAMITNDGQLIIQ